MYRNCGLLVLAILTSLAIADNPRPAYADDTSSDKASDAAAVPAAEAVKPAEETEAAEESKPVEAAKPAESPYLAHGNILAVRGSSLVLTGEETAGLKEGVEFEVYVELPQGLGTAILATGKVASNDDGLLIGKITSKDETAKLSTELKVRFLKPKTTEKPPAEETPNKPPAPMKTVTTKKVTVPDVIEPPSKGFQASVERYKRAVLLVKDSENKSHGTAFVISKKHRLLATNAHVADIAETVVLNETRTEYKVTRRWFHPDTLRTMREDNQTVMKSSDPSVGTVDARGTDLAVLQLEMIGPELPAEVVLANPDEAKTIIGAEIGMYGYPAYNTQAASGQFAQATFVKGTVSRFEKLNGHPDDQRVEDRRRVVYAGPNYPGFSGSPIFLDNGRVVIINHAVTNLQDGTKVAYGIRVDALWDMLGHFQLAEKIEAAPETLPDPLFIEGQNPQVEKLQTAIKLMNDAREYHKQGDFAECFDAMSEAEKTAPWYWDVYFTRAKMVDEYINRVELSREDQALCYEASLSYLAKANELHLKIFNIRALPILLDFARQSINVARFRENVEVLKQAIEVLEDKEVVKVAFEGKNAAYFLALRATVKRDLGTMKRDIEWFKGAMADIEEAIRLQPGHKDYLQEKQRILLSAQQAGVIPNN